jgi:hypothetical protein
MNMDGAKPLFDDATAPHELRSFVAMARGDGPSQADLDRLAARLGPVVGLSAGLLATSAAVLGSAPIGVASAPTVVAKVGTLGKLLASGTGKLLAVGLSLGIGAGLWSLTGSETQPQRRASPPVVKQAESAPVQSAPTLAPATAQPPAEQQRQITRPAAAPRGRARPVAAKPSAPEVVVAAAEPVPSELSLLQQAESARGRSSEALAILARHEQLYPRGALAQEREILSVEMLLKAGNVAQARARAARFEAQNPGSAHLPRLRSLLARAAVE